MTPREPTAPPEAGSYRGCRIAVGTAHGKAPAPGPPFAEIPGARLVTPAGLDTDRFGTFSGETPRTGAASETGRAKARLGMRAARLPYGLASEASYGPQPGIGLPGQEEIHACAACPHREAGPVETAADPGSCPPCNP